MKFKIRNIYIDQSRVIELNKEKKICTTNLDLC